MRHFEIAERETWLQDLPPGVDYRFFLGYAPVFSLVDDEEYLDVGDSFSDVTAKSVAMHRWALEHGYDYVVKVDLDTFVRPVKLLQSGFENWDYTGGLNSQGIDFASGGGGYCLSRKAMKFVAEAPIVSGPAEDVHIARVLLAHGMYLHADDRYKFVPGSVMDENTLTYHLSSVVAWDAKYKPEWMYAAYAAKGPYTPAVEVAAPAARRFQRLRRM
jgi:hypothetical protein